MKIAVLMFGGKRGGVEQAAVDYCEALKSAGHEVTAFVRKGAAILPGLAALSLPIEQIPAPHPWNIFVRTLLQQKLQQFDVVFVHGNRAGQLTTGKRLPPVIAVAHSRFFKKLPHFAAIVALSEPRARQLDTPHVIPNLIRLPNVQPQPFRQPPVIGTLGRFVPEKGFDLLLEALALLHERGLDFRCIIGGGGRLESALKLRAAQLGLTPLVTWCGWVHDKDAFYSSLDIFCMPSRTESFPISLLEAMGYALPIVATDCGGTASILTDHATGVLCAIRPDEIASALGELLISPERAHSMAAAARTAAEQRFALPVVAQKLDALVKLAAA